MFNSNLLQNVTGTGNISDSMKPYYNSIDNIYLSRTIIVRTIFFTDRIFFLALTNIQDSSLPSPYSYSRSRLEFLDNSKSSMTVTNDRPDASWTSQGY